VTPANQVKDFNAGIAPSGLFWTVPIPRSAVRLGPGRLSYRLNRFPVREHGHVANALAGGPSRPALAWFDIRWFSPQKRYVARDATNRFTWDFQTTKASAQWYAEEEGFSFRSDPARTSHEVIAAVGRERNGVFFK
jgi:hypothetical protein